MYLMRVLFFKKYFAFKTRKIVHISNQFDVKATHEVLGAIEVNYFFVKSDCHVLYLSLTACKMYGMLGATGGTVNEIIS